MIELKPNDREKSSAELYGIKASIFLAGSIEMGAAEKWQEKVCQFFDDQEIVFYNPLRDSWDSSLEQRQRVPIFNQQVNWEMSHLQSCDIIFMYFDPATKSPISLLELGLHASSGKLIVCCPDGFWRKGNVEIVCQRYNIPLFHTFHDAIGGLRTILYKYL